MNHQNRIQTKVLTRKEPIEKATMFPKQPMIQQLRKIQCSGWLRMLLQKPGQMPVERQRGMAGQAGMETLQKKEMKLQ